MRTDLERDDFIALLEKLKGEDEADILAAVRDLNAKMTVAGVSWDDLLISQDDTPAATDYSDDDEDEDEDEDEGEGEGEVEQAEDDDSDLKPLSAEEKVEAASLIAAIRGMEISDLTKDELEEYEDDLEHGEFEQMDLRYLKALKARLSA